MVIVSASVCTKGGKLIFCRQFVDISKADVESLYAKFSDLLARSVYNQEDGAESPTRMAETESHRYVYQPVFKLSLIVVIVTTKDSNYFDDLKSLEMFADIVVEQCLTSCISECDYQNEHLLSYVIITRWIPELINAFDEVVSVGGHRENVTWLQIRTILEMQSADEKEYLLARQKKEADAKLIMQKKVKEFRNQVAYPADKSSSSAKSTRKPSTTAVSEKSKTPTNVEKRASISSSTASRPKVTIWMKERLNVSCRRGGMLRSMEVEGSLTVLVGDESCRRLNIQLDNSETRPIQKQTGASIDKDLFDSEQKIAPRSDGLFPLDEKLELLKWRFRTEEEEWLPLKIRCTSQPNGMRSVQYELNNESDNLKDVIIAIPLSPAAGVPRVSEHEGECDYEACKNVLNWKLPHVDSSNAKGSLEFCCRGEQDDFFPISVHFSSRLFVNLSVVDAFARASDCTHIPCDLEVCSGMQTERYVIL